MSDLLSLKIEDLTDEIKEQLKDFDAKEYMALQIQSMEVENNDVLELKIDKIESVTSSDQLGAAWAWYYLDQASKEKDTDADCTIEDADRDAIWEWVLHAERSLAGETDRHRNTWVAKNSSWHTAALIEMCRLLRERLSKAKAEDIFNALPDSNPILPITKVKMSDFGSLRIEGANTSHKDRNMELNSFKVFLTKNRNRIGCKK